MKIMFPLKCLYARRKFIKDTSTVAFGIGVFGNITRAKEHFIGDTPTTTDILGPFYRPAAPFRENLNPKDFKGEVLHLAGTIFKEDGRTPMPNCLIEVWQCRADGLYDNTSKTICTEPVKRLQLTATIFYYNQTGCVCGGGKFTHLSTCSYSLAHFCHRTTDLITQIYFTGDPYLGSDPSTNSSLAVNRILSLRPINSNEVKSGLTLF
jgi:protocatechuate 3,4-dioxygenase beta subunit